jgi:hypothetical protein
MAGRPFPRMKSSQHGNQVSHPSTAAVAQEPHEYCPLDGHSALP